MSTVEDDLVFTVEVIEVFTVVVEFLWFIVNLVDEIGYIFLHRV